MADSTGPDTADRSAARALGALWGGVHVDLEALVRRGVVAFLARRDPRAAGVRTHAMGPELLAGVEEAAGADAADRARRVLDRGLRAARVAARLGPGGTCGLTEDQLDHLSDVDDTLLAALGADLRARPLPHAGLASLWRRLGEVAKRLKVAAPGVGARLDEGLWDQTRRRLLRLESDFEALCEPGLRLFLGPVDLPAMLGVRAVRDLEPPPAVGGRADPPAVAGSPEAGTSRPARGSPWPSVPTLRWLRAWCRQVAPRLTPFWQERLLLRL